MIELRKESNPRVRENGQMPAAWTPESPDRVIHDDNLVAVAGLPDAVFTLVYLDPPFNTGRS